MPVGAVVPAAILFIATGTVAPTVGDVCRLATGFRKLLGVVVSAAILFIATGTVAPTAAIPRFQVISSKCNRDRDGRFYNSSGRR